MAARRGVPLPAADRLRIAERLSRFQGHGAECQPREEGRYRPQAERPGRRRQARCAAASRVAAEIETEIRGAPGARTVALAPAQTAARTTASRAERRSFTLALFSCPQAAMMSSPRGVRTGLA